MKATLLFLLLLPLSNHVFASLGSEEVLGLLKTDLKIFTKTLSRDIPVYTWVKSDRLTKNYGLPKKSSVIYNHKAFRKFVESRTKKLFKYDKTEEQWLGNGIYTYHNPVGSAEYGDVVIEIIIPKGKAYLDLRYTNLEFEGFLPDREIKLTKPTINAIDQLFSCSAPLKNDAVTVGLLNEKEYFSLSKNYFVNCTARAKFFKKALTELNIAFLNYAWSAGDVALSYCPDSNAGTAAQMFVEGAWLAKAQITGYLRTFTDEFGPEHRNAYRSIDLFTRALTYATPTWDTFFGGSITEEAITKIKSKFGCGQYPEDEILANIEQL